jgi:diaminopimelate decarboxylase
VARVAASLPGVELVGLDMHLGSMLSRVEPYGRGAERLLELCRTLQDEGVRTLRYLDIGGGYGVRYDQETPVDLPELAATIGTLVRDSGLELILEPGRFIVGNAGVLLARTLYRKRSGGKDYVIADAGMTELLRPSHYHAYHRIEAVHEVAGQATVDVVGPVCESGDFLALDRTMDDVPAGDLLAVFDAGAYGYVMSSTYNSRRRVPEVLVDGDRFAVTTMRETYDDLMRLEVDQPEWRS